MSLIIALQSKRLLSALYYSNAVFCELSYLPALVFPLVKTIESEIILFESVVTILGNIGYRKYIHKM